MNRAIMHWRKSWIDENLEGSIRIDLEPAERSVWSDLCDLCGKSRRWGIIERSEGIPYTIEDFAYKFKTPSSIIESTIAKCLKEGRLQRDSTGAFIVANWDRYQQEPRVKASKRQDIPMASEDRAAAVQASAARLGYLDPEAAKRGIQLKEFEEDVKAKNKD